MTSDVEPSRSALVKMSIDAGVATLTLADPGRRNCVSRQLSADVSQAAASIRDSRDARVLVLRAEGPVFSAGGDVDSLERGDTPLEELYRGFNALQALAIPTLAAVQGPVVGAGLNFALACDVIVAAESAYFESRFLDIGIHPGGGVLWSLAQRIGQQAAGAMALFGERVTARDAERLGLVWRVVADADLHRATQSMADRVANLPGDLTRRTKASLGASVPITNRRDAVDLEEVAQRWSMAQPAFAAGVARMRSRLNGQA